MEMPPRKASPFLNQSTGRHIHTIYHGQISKIKGKKNQFHENEAQPYQKYQPELEFNIHSPRQPINNMYIEL